MKIFAGSDHAGFGLKKILLENLKKSGYEVFDLGTDNEHSCDYPDFAHLVSEKVLATPGSMGLLTCGSGLGMSMAANRHPGIRAALCRDALEARLARQHNDANILVMGGRIVGEEHAIESAEVFYKTSFSGGRHENRVKKIETGKK